MAGCFEGYQLKLNSLRSWRRYRTGGRGAAAPLRASPAVKVVVLRSAKKPRVSAPAPNIRMLAGATHAHKVNFCKFTNETRNGP